MKTEDRWKMKQTRKKDEKQAIKDILEIKDFNAFLKASGYDEKFSVDSTQKTI